jgi:hypothetical protein
MLSRLAVLAGVALLASIGGPPVSQAQSGPSFSVQFGTWRTCAAENQTCRVPYPSVVRFGANGRYVTLHINRSVTCSRNVFGDPIVGVRKQCQYQAIGFPPRPQPTRMYCAQEGGVCYFRGTARIQYGADNRFITRTLSDDTRCTNAVFGDPAPGRVKACYIAR